MKKRENNLRRDLYTYKKFNKSELIRICLIDGKFIIDDNNEISKRGIYFNLDNYAKNKVFKCKQKISKAFKINISDVQLTQLESELEKWITSNV